MTDHDVLDRVRDARPAAPTAQRLWPTDERAAVLASVLEGRDAADAPVRSRRRYGLGAAAAAVVALVLVGGSVVLPSDGPAGPSAAAAVLNRLALAAGAAPADTMRPGQFWHSIEKSEQVTSDHEVRRETKQVWTASDGTVWRRDTGRGRTHVFVMPPSEAPSLNAPTPALLATYPTDRRALADLIDDQYADHYEDHDARVVMAVGDMLRQGFAPPALRAAALGVLADLDDVQVVEGMKDLAGRTVTGLRVRTSDEGGRSESYLLIDPTTSRIVGERESFVPADKRPHPGITSSLSYSSATLDAGVVDAVPASIRRNAVDTSVSVDTTCSVNGTC